MQSFVIFSNEELADMISGKSVEDEVNNITYVNEDTYKKILESKDDRWDW